MKFREAEKVAQVSQQMVGDLGLDPGVRPACTCPGSELVPWARAASSYPMPTTLPKPALSRVSVTDAV